MFCNNCKIKLYPNTSVPNKTGFLLCFDCFVDLDEDVEFINNGDAQYDEIYFNMINNRLSVFDNGRL